MATLDTYRERARTFLRDDTAAFVDDDDLDAWANEAAADLAARLSILDGEVTGTTSGDTLAIPLTGGTDLEAVEIVSLHIDGSLVMFVSDAVWDSWQELTGEPTSTLGRVFGDVIELYPTPDDGLDYTLRFRGTPVPMVQSDSTPGLPRHLDRKIVAYMVSMGMLKSGEDPTNYLALYEQGLPQVVSGRARQHPGPTELVPDRGPFGWDDGYNA